MSNIDTILNCLSKVKALGHGRYKALCPCHSEKTPSLSVTDLGDGRIIAHCFGCGANGLDIVAAIGLEPSELFPKQPKNERQGYKPVRKPFPAADVLESLLHEATIVMLAASDICNGVAVSKADFERIELANKRISMAVQYAKGK
jgi:hypothetical protein